MLAEARDLVYAEEAEIWRRFGYMSMLEYMQRELFYEGHTARERVRVANKLFELPALAEAFREGELSFSALKELTRIVVPETEDVWRAAASGDWTQARGTTNLAVRRSSFARATSGAGNHWSCGPSAKAAKQPPPSTSS